MKNRIPILFQVLIAWITFSGLHAQTVKDIDGNVYKTLPIGTQVWMAENLKTTRYSDGTAIPLVTDAISWFELTTPAYCWYKNDKKSGSRYGALYTWYTVGTGKLCPAGWHVPSDAEWNILSAYLRSTYDQGKDTSVHDPAQKPSAHPELIDNTAFPVASGGVRMNNGSFSLTGFDYWWSGTELDAKTGHIRFIYSDKIFLSADRYAKNYGFSVRCVKD